MRMPRCVEGKKCFGQVKGLDGLNRCYVLVEPFPDRPCPFCKEERDVTDGKKYPYDANYGGKKGEEL